MKKLSYFLAAIFVVSTMMASVSSCDKDKTPIAVPNECADTVSFVQKIEPMIQMNCSTTGCHDATSSASGYNLEGHGNISANGTAILNVIRHEAGFTPMPLGQSQLNDSLISQFNCWVAQGKLNN